MPSVHHPKISDRPDGRWEVRCPECEGSSQTVPVGIGVPIGDPLMAARLRANHAASHQTQASERVTGRV